MKLRIRVGLAIFFILFAVGIHFYSLNSYRVEWQYSLGFFPTFAANLRNVFGKYSTSIGDILYMLFFLWMVYKVGHFIYSFIRRKKEKKDSSWYLSTVSGWVIFLSALYIFFNIFWGFNYNRKGIAWQLGLELKPYALTDVLALNNILVEKVNRSRQHLPAEHPGYTSQEELTRQVHSAYNNAAVSFPFLQYKTPSLKSSLWGWLGNYTGFTGYYNPFTGEAQVNTTVPAFLQPFIACHEVAHQLGYAKEMEANFVGYLAARSSADTLMRYSVYLDLFLYANRNLYAADSLAAKNIRRTLDTAVVQDLQTWKNFNERHRSFLEPVVRFIYGSYLRNNEQPQGMRSYDEVTSFLIAYYKKFGYI